MGMDVAPNPNPPDIWISIYLHTMYISIIIFKHFSGILAIIIWTIFRNIKATIFQPRNT
jgi:hypothetical protein